MPVHIRPLTPEDAPRYRALRLRALREHPEAFATSLEEELARPPAETAARLETAAGRLTLGAFEEDRLVGIATLLRHDRVKLRHRATLTAMYVVPESRERRVGRALLEALLARAYEWGVAGVDLGVTVGNHAARQLYASAGFATYGIEPRALLVEGQFYDVEWMNLRFGSG